jgi:hypothetical protein
MRDVVGAGAWDAVAAAIISLSFSAIGFRLSAIGYRLSVIRCLFLADGRKPTADNRR